MKENRFQSKLIKRIKELFPGCIVLKNNPNYIQGFPDLTILYKDKWAVLECKRSETADHQPNQDYYILKLNEMSYSNIVSPENEKLVLEDLKGLFER